MFSTHKGKRKAKCIGDRMRAAEEVKRKLEAKLTLGEFALPEEKSPAPTRTQYAAIMAKAAVWICRST